MSEKLKKGSMWRSLKYRFDNNLFVYVVYRLCILIYIGILFIYTILTLDNFEKKNDNRDT